MKKRKKMPKFKVTVWYPMEAEVIVEADSKELAEHNVLYEYSDVELDYKDAGELFVKEVIEVDDAGEEVEE
jgi:hypothetical protein